MTKSNKVYAVMYNPCTYESSFGVVSLHYDFQAASKECNDLENARKDYWKDDLESEMPEYEVFKVQEFEVQ